MTNPVVTQPEAPEPEDPAQEASKPAEENQAPAGNQTTAEKPSKPEVPATPVKEDQPSTETPSTATPSVTPAKETQQDTTTGYHAYVLRIVELVNEARAQAGLQPVTLRQDLTAVAQLRAKETVTLFSHTRPNGSSCFTALGEYGVSYRGAGENIAYGQRSPEEVMEGWMNSSGHRANILNANFTSIGVGYYQSANGVKYWSQMFTY
ncbi:MAG: CAP domain-containing protein [Lachnospiraceae bacterium]|nr:CAP domain-containing protein [Lachnospiraceae bacterium]